MADLMEKDAIDESATPDPRPARDTGKPGKKKKGKRGCGFFLVLMLLAIGLAAGLQASGGVDLRPYVYPIVPHIPGVGQELAGLLAIPEKYALTAAERRRIELDEWEARIAESARSLDEMERNLSALSGDLAEKEQSLDAQRDEVAARLEALSNDMAGRGIGLGAEPPGSADKSAIDETIRTFQDMSPRNAAAILEKLDENLAVSILDGLPQDARGTLLGRMDAEVAARLTEQLTELQRRKQRQ
ncbi:MAG: MgtE intracellular region [Synergistaceae bacterium]|jgi:flagellar motility protein MotE (MotC chaperone)|nr:MgtE intracellular region [Synergistaceae bacterium]